MDDKTPDNQINTSNSSSEGAQITGNVNTEGGDLIGRDKTVGGDEVGRDKVGRDVYYVSGQQVVIQQYQTTYPPVVDSTLVGEEPAPGESPYKGLEFFDVADAGIFFGREQLTAELVAYLHQHRFLAVVGASGSGKSSIVRAGLAPALKRGKPLVDGILPPKGSNRWPVHIITPRAHPLEQLAATLTQGSESVRAQATLLDDLTKEPRSLHFYAARLLSTVASDRLLLVVDQFEEIFTLCRDPQERQAFVDNLLTAVVDDGVTTVIITLRADFYHRCADFANLRLALQKDQKYIGPMSEEELRRAIEEPARISGWELESGLVDLLLDDVAQEPGALPLLSHALLETWKRRRGRTLTLAGYAASGRVQGAIAKTAEDVLNQQLTPEQRPIARNIFVRLTELGEGVQDTRRRVALSELFPQSEETETVEKVLKALADARLITTDQDPTTGQREVEVAHEALIREWGTLREWLQDDREGLRTHHRLTEAAAEWAMQQDPGFLYRGTRLTQIEEWAQTHAGAINAQERAFLAASLAERQHEIDEKEHIEREREQARENELENARSLAAESEARHQAEAERAQAAEEAEQASQRELQQTRTARNRSLMALGATAAALLLAIIIGIVLYQQYRAERVQRLKLDALSEARQLKEALDASGAIAKFREADSLAAASGIDLGIDLTDKVTDTLRFVATSKVQAGEAILRNAIDSDSDEVRQTAYLSATALFSQALALNPPSDTPVYVQISAGEFLLGSDDTDDLVFDDEKPQHSVYLDEYWIQRTEVTKAQYRRCMEEGPCEPLYDQQIDNPQFGRRPVVSVNWHQARTYAEWVGGRLPTEAEWEKACRGVDSRIYPWGNDAPDVDRLNYHDSAYGVAIEVGSYPPGANGLYDMAGNVWEWTSSQFQDYPYAADDGREDLEVGEVAPTLRRGLFAHLGREDLEVGDFAPTLRGGWFAGNALTVRCAYRNLYYPDYDPSHNGFRVVVGWSPGL